MAFRLRQHPRIHNKPLRCRNGLHGPWETSVLGGRPVMVCKSCGANIFKEVREHTLSKYEYRKAFNSHVDMMQQRRSLLRKRILEALGADY